MSTAMINTELPLRVSETLKLPFSPAEIVSYVTHAIRKLTNHVNRQAKDHRPDRSAQVQGAQFP
jgi:hypothetical protein